MNLEKKMANAFWWAFIVFLIPSIPHMATVFRSWEPIYPDDLAGNITSGFWWAISVLGAMVIDGTVIYLSRLIASEIEATSRNWGYIGLLGFFVFVLTAFSWQMNIWYALMNQSVAATALGQAYTSDVLGNWSSSTVMPYVVSALPLLGIMFTIMAGKIKQAQQNGQTPTMTDAQYQAEVTRLTREKELKKLRKSDNESGLFSAGKEKLFGKEKDLQSVHNARLNATVDYLRDAQELLPISEERRAVFALARILKMKEPDALPYLIAARSRIVEEQQSALKTDSESDSQTDTETDNFKTGDGEFSAASADLETDNVSSGDRPRKPMYTTLEDAVQSLGYSKEYVQKLVRAGTLSTKKSDRNKILVSSVDKYLSLHKRGIETDSIPTAPRTENRPATIIDLAQRTDFSESDKLQITIDFLHKNPSATDEDLAEELHLKRPASARFWRLKATEILALNRTANG